MTPYLYILYSSIVGTLILCFFKDETKWIGICLLIWLTLFIAFRGEYIGIDTPEYYAYFKHPQLGYYGKPTHDLGYNTYQALFKLLIDNAYVYIPVTSIVGLIPIICFIVKKSQNIAMSVFLFLTLGGSTLFLFLYLAAVRQTFAIGFLWWALYFYYNKDKKKSTFFYLLAVLTHTSMLIYLPIIFVDRIKTSKIVIYLVLILSLILGLVLNQFVSYFYMLVSFFNYGTYYVNVLAESTAILGGSMLFMTFLAGIVVYFNNLESYSDRLFIAGAILNNVFAFMGDATRISMPLALFGLVSVVNTIMSRANFLKYLLLFLVLIYSSNKYFKVLNQNGKTSNMVPYKSLIVK